MVWVGLDLCGFAWSGLIWVVGWSRYVGLGWSGWWLMVADGDGGYGSGLIGLIWVGGSGLIGLIWVCVEAWRCGGMETMAFWSALIFLCVGWSVLVDLMLNLIFRVGWSVCVGWSDFSLVSDDGGDGGWVVMVVVMVAVGLWERGTVREWIIKISKIMNILLNRCVE